MSDDAERPTITLGVEEYQALYGLRLAVAGFLERRQDRRTRAWHRRRVREELARCLAAEAAADAAYKARQAAWEARLGRTPDQPEAAAP